MFIPRKPDAAVAKKELIGNVRSFAIAVVVIRASTYVLDFLQSKS